MISALRRYDFFILSNLLLLQNRLANPRRGRAKLRFHQLAVCAGLEPIH